MMDGWLCYNSYTGVANPLRRGETLLFYKTLFSQCKLWGGEGWGGRDTTCAHSSWALYSWYTVSSVMGVVPRLIIQVRVVKKKISVLACFQAKYALS